MPVKNGMFRECENIKRSTKISVEWFLKMKECLHVIKITCYFGTVTY